jgi:adenylylsulfate kinase
MSWAIWITGLPGCGKSTLALSAAAELLAVGERVVVLELDAARKVLTPTPTYSGAERELVYHALVATAVALVDAGVPVIIDATAHRRAWRDLARARISKFAEVQLLCPIDVCRVREQARSVGNAPAGIYGAAGHATGAVPGVHVVYEAALAPELVIDTVHEPRDSAARRIVALALELAWSAPAKRSHSSAGWAIWICGPPGSGKSTLAARVAESLMPGGIKVAVLTIDKLRHIVASRGEVSPDEDEMLHRALVYAAGLLADSGIPVLIDAAGPKRGWRDLARKRIVRFAEVELSCPFEVCLARDRSARWGPRSGTLEEKLRPGPPVTFDHEYAPDAELVVRTDRESVWSAVVRVRQLAERLHRVAAMATVLATKEGISCTSES